MPSGKTTKTEFMRYLDENESSVKPLLDAALEYEQHNIRKSAFGFWVRWKYKAKFDRAYESWWLKHPELFS